MKELTLTGFQEFIINSASTEGKYRLHVPANESASVVVTLEGNKEVEIDIKIIVEENAQLRLLTINHNEDKSIFNEEYELFADSSTTIAHAELNKAQTTINSVHKILQQGANLQVNTASLTTTQKNFYQDTFHYAGNSRAHVNNYGVVLANGICDMVVRSTIEKGSHGAATHQSSRLLTYDKTSIGKILPVLYIYDNDVQASHAASLGQPDDEQLYYLETRGISHQEALQLLITGYLLPITRIIDDEKIVEALTLEIETKVAEGCSM